MSNAYHRFRVIVDDVSRAFFRVPDFVAVRLFGYPVLHFLVYFSVYRVFFVCLNVLCVDRAVRFSGVRACYSSVALLVVDPMASVRVRDPELHERFACSICRSSCHVQAVR